MTKEEFDSSTFGKDYEITHKKTTTMSDTILTNEWTDATTKKPWKDRLVLCHLDDDTFVVAKWNGMYWVGQDNKKVVETVQRRVTHFYIFEKFNENNIL